MKRLALLVCGLVLALPAAALDYLSIAEPAVLFDAPSQQGTPLYAIARGTPVESIVVLDAWVKVRDASGELAWIEKRLLSERRTVIVQAPVAQVRARPDESAGVAFAAVRDVLLDFVEPGPTGWVKVRARDGRQGYVKAIEVWGA